MQPATSAKARQAPISSSSSSSSSSFPEKASKAPLFQLPAIPGKKNTGARTDGERQETGEKERVGCCESAWMPGKEGERECKRREGEDGGKFRREGRRGGFMVAASLAR